jgi:hypothetical protein
MADFKRGRQATGNTEARRVPRRGNSSPGRNPSPRDRARRAGLTALVALLFLLLAYWINFHLLEGPKSRVTQQPPGEITQKIQGIKDTIDTVKMLAPGQHAVGTTPSVPPEALMKAIQEKLGAGQQAAPETSE